MHEGRTSSSSSSSSDRGLCRRSGSLPHKQTVSAPAGAIPDSVPRKALHHVVQSAMSQQALLLLSNILALNASEPCCHRNSAVCGHGRGWNCLLYVS